MATEPSEGVIKFKFNLKMSSKIEESLYIDLEKWRVILYKMNLIGEYPIEKVGFGNLSRKVHPHENQFIITGTQTGKFPNLSGSQYTKVTKCDLQKMSIDAVGPIAPSSESLTHYAIYETCPQVKAIFHVHHNELWNYMLAGEYKKTADNINYGTHEMAQEAQKCIGKNLKGIFVMAGHQDGIIAYGSSTEEAGKIILETLKESKK
ncbi:MAG: ribulose-5-phosphate 4-epimerase/fuculose-1-phosphate aldolase [Bacteriovoracaceae bacterium]|jgi:ribulose-5-phosphate 4-epimerase/fuculose-1-phosphate aldolase